MRGKKWQRNVKDPYLAAIERLVVRSMTVRKTQDAQHAQGATSCPEKEDG